MQPVVRLKELLDRKHWGQPSYSAESQIDGVWHTCVSISAPIQDYELRAQGAGGTKQEARNAAAAAVLSRLEQLGLCPPASSAAGEPGTQAGSSYINRLQEFLQAPGRRDWRVVYTEVQRTPHSAHCSNWVATVRLLDHSGVERLRVSGGGTNKTAAKQQAARGLLTTPEFLRIFSHYKSSTDEAAAAAKAKAGHHIPDQKASPAAATAARALEPVAVTANFKAELQELLHAAASKSLGDWAAWGLPEYSHQRSGPDHATQFTATAVLQGPGDKLLSAQGQPGTCKKDAEQLAAAAMLQTPQLQNVRAALDQELQRKMSSSGSMHSGSGSHAGQGGGAAMQKLNELVAQAAWCMEEPEIRQMSGSARCMPTLEATVVINGYLLAVGHGKTKGNAKAAAAQAALACMDLAPLPPSLAPAPPPMPPPPAAAAPHPRPQLSSAAAPFFPTPVPAPQFYIAAAALPFGCSHAAAPSTTCISGTAQATRTPPPPSLARPSAPSASAGSLGWCSRLSTYLPAATIPQPAVAVAGADTAPVTPPAAPTGDQLAMAVQNLSLLKFDQVVQHAVRTGVVSGANVNNTVVAAYLLETPGSSQLEVVALGSGTSFCAQAEQQLVREGQRGRLLLDSHAEVVARRSLMRWLYGQAQLALQQQQQQLACVPTVTPVLEVVSTPGPAADVANQSISISSGVCTTRSGIVTAAVRCATGNLVGNSSSTQAGQNSSSNSSSTLMFRLKPGVKLHMYISKPPCGDACIFNRPNSSSAHARRCAHFSHARPRMQLTSRLTQVSSGSQQLLPTAAALGAHWPQNCALLNPAAAVAGCGLLRGKVLQGENCSPLPGVIRRSSISDTGSSDGSLSRSSSKASLSSSSSSQQRLRKVCCSDKLARWNALGLQGALLGMVLQPVYVSSITVGGDTKDYCEGALSRAVCCRLAPHTPAAPAPPASPNVSHLPGESWHPNRHQPVQQQHIGAVDGWQGSRAAAAAAAARQYKEQQHHGQYTWHSCSRQQQQQQPPPQSPSLQQWQPYGPNMSAALQRGLHLTHPFRVNHPQLLHAPASEGLPAVQAGGYGSSCCNSSRESFNWNASEPLELEVTSGDQGTLLRVLNISQGTGTANMMWLPAAATAVGRRATHGSKLSKRSMFACFLQLIQQQQQQQQGLGYATPISNATCRDSDSGSMSPHADGLIGCSCGMSYAEAKGVNKQYTAAKARLYQHFKDRTGQQWMQRKAMLPDLELFTVLDLQAGSSDDGPWPSSHRSSSSSSAGGSMHC